MATNSLAQMYSDDTTFLNQYSIEDLIEVEKKLLFNSPDLEIMKAITKLNWSMKSESHIDLKSIILSSDNISPEDKEFIISNLKLLNFFVPVGAAGKQKNVKPTEKDNLLHKSLLTLAAVIILPTFAVFNDYRANELKLQEINIQKEQNEIENFIKLRELEQTDRSLELEEKEIEDKE